MLDAVNVPPPPHWPGACDASLSRPDHVKFELATFAQDRRPGKAKLKQFEKQIANGLLPEIEHWAMEEFFWHGLPDDDWHPIDTFLAQHEDRFSAVARQQLSLWKQARIGAYEIGDVRDSSVTFYEWDLVEANRTGPVVQAITLNIGGVNVYRKMGGQITVTYVAPWAPDENLFCGMGYGVTVPKRLAPMLSPLLGLRKPDVVARPWPWKESWAAGREYRAQWRSRDWQTWFEHHIEFPFDALVDAPQHAAKQLRRIDELIAATPEQARQFGVYFAAPSADGKDVMVCGASTLLPVDVGSSNMAAIAEYQAYRDQVGPPPGMRGQPQFMKFK